MPSPAISSLTLLRRWQHEQGSGQVEEEVVEGRVVGRAGGRRLIGAGKVKDKAQNAVVWEKATYDKASAERCWPLRAVGPDRIGGGTDSSGRLRLSRRRLRPLESASDTASRS